MGISIKNSDPQKYQIRIEKLIEALSNDIDRFSINAVEAIMIVELFSDSVNVNQDGELVITTKTARKFSETIYNDPMKYLTYIKAIETKIDYHDKRNKIPLNDVLYMMRNARKFGLNIDTTDQNKSNIAYTIKSAIHDAYYQDVVINLTFAPKPKHFLSHILQYTDNRGLIFISIYNIINFSYFFKNSYESLHSYSYNAHKIKVFLVNYIGEKLKVV